MKKNSAILVLASVFLLAGAYWSWKEIQHSAFAIRTLRLSLDNEIESFDPAKTYSDDSLVVASQVLEPLYQYHYLKRPFEVQPLLAESLPRLENRGRTLVVPIKRGVIYHDHPAFSGTQREVMAEDFILQFKRLAMNSLKSPGRGLFDSLVIGFSEYSGKIGDDWAKLNDIEIEGVVARDSHTLVIHLHRSEPNMVYYLAMNFIVPVPWELVSFYKNNLDEILVGTGPYVYMGNNGQYLEMHKNSKYREDYYPTVGDRYANVTNLLDSSRERIPFIESVRFYVYKEEERWEKFLESEIDLLTVPKTFITRLFEESGELHEAFEEQKVLLKHFPMLTTRWFGFNMRDPIWGKNKNLRKAIAYGIDYNKYLQIISQNTNLRANSILVPGIAGYRPAQDFRFQYDPEKAKTLLAEAGFKSVDDLPTLTYSTRGTEGIALEEAEFVKESLAGIGIKVSVEKLSFTDFLKKGRAGELQFFTDAWIFDYPDGENIMQLLVSTNFPGINKSGFSHPEIDKLYNRLKEENNFESRERILKSMEEIVFEELPWIPLMYESSFVLQYPRIKNYRKSSLVRNYVKYLKIQE